MSNGEIPDDLTEKIKILATDDEKIKSFGELFTNDSSRKILQLLFNEELTATQIAQKTDTSLQLVKYHLNKLQSLGIVKISRIEKNSKSQDMKIYSATKFSIIIVPPKLSEKTKESKLLVKSFRHIYKVVGLGIATGISGLFSLSLSGTDGTIPASETVASRQPSLTPESNVMESIASDEFADSSMSAHMPSSDYDIQTEFDPSRESQKPFPSDLEANAIDVVDTMSGGHDLLVSFVVVTVILGGLTAFYLWKLLKSK